MLVDVWLELMFVTDDVGVLDMMVEGGDVDHVHLDLVLLSHPNKTSMSL